MAKFDFEKVTKKFSTTRGKDKLKVSMRPYRDWGILLGIFFVLLVFVAIANAYLFIQINNEEIFAKERPVEEEIEMLNIKTLESTIEFFDARAANFNDIIKQKPDIVDPAL